MLSLEHPLLISTYVVILPLVAVAVVGLFRRLGKVETKTDRLEELVGEMRDEVKVQGESLAETMTAFRVHMAEEATNMTHLMSRLDSMDRMLRRSARVDNEA